MWETNSALAGDDSQACYGHRSGSQLESWRTMKTIERRKQNRLALHWRLSLSGGTIGTIETITENLSGHGFYCILEKPLVPGDIIDCDITVPQYGPAHQGGIGSIACQAEVVRVETRGAEPGFGVACRILDFNLNKKSRFPNDRGNGGSFNDWPAVPG
jgi:hypothetical protein